MARTLWGKVYMKDAYAGRLHEEPGGRCVFTDDASYLAAGLPTIAYTLPPRAEPYIAERGLHPFFDNLIAEGWFRSNSKKVPAGRYQRSHQYKWCRRHF
jgi:serine/threonine-protein kinase HipA